MNVNQKLSHRHCGELPVLSLQAHQPSPRRAAFLSAGAGAACLTSPSPLLSHSARAPDRQE
jgi:hypothetical protein